MKRLFILMAGLSLLGWPTLVCAQVSPALVEQIVAARQKNAALMRQFSWESRTELIEDGAVKDIRLEQNTYGPDGQLQRTLVNDQPAALPSGFLRKRIAEREREKTENYLKGLRVLLDQYTLPITGRTLDFVSQATVLPADASGLLQISRGSVGVPGDSVSLWVSAVNLQPQRMKVMTFYQGSEVTVTVSFKTLANGLTYPAYGQVDVFGKGLSLQVQNFNYINQNI